MIYEDMLYMNGLLKENSTNTRALIIAAPAFCVSLVEQLTSEKKGHDDNARMCNF